MPGLEPFLGLAYRNALAYFEVVSWEEMSDSPVLRTGYFLNANSYRGEALANVTLTYHHIHPNGPIQVRK
jgi:hypothetical protein